MKGNRSSQSSRNVAPLIRAVDYCLDELRDEWRGTLLPLFIQLYSEGGASPDPKVVNALYESVVRANSLAFSAEDLLTTIQVLVQYSPEASRAPKANPRMSFKPAQIRWLSKEDRWILDFVGETDRELVRRLFGRASGPRRRSAVGSLSAAQRERMRSTLDHFEGHLRDMKMQLETSLGAG